MSILYEFEDNYGHKHNLIKEISRGGQGAVYRTSDRNIAVKLCLIDDEPVLDDSQNNDFNKIRLLPFPKSLNLTLPRAVLKGASGYVMDLLEDMSSFEDIFNIERYSPQDNEWLKYIGQTNPICADIFGRYIASGGSRRRLELYMRCAALLARLHCSGLVYCDISSRNIFGSSNPKKNNVWLIDSDNVNYQEITMTGAKSFYTMGYAAPELLDDGIASMYSDSYAFAISFFWDLTRTHPFKGKKYYELRKSEDFFSEDTEAQMYSGIEPWIYDTENDSNCYQSTIPADLVLDSQMMNLMQRMFSECSRLDEITERPTMLEMAEGIAHVADTTVRCHHCGMDSVFPEKCPWCDAKQRTLMLKSWYLVNGEQKRELWHFNRELSEDTRIIVPERLVKDFSPESVDGIAFVAAINNDAVILTDFIADSDIYVKEPNMDYKRVYGSYHTKCDSFTIKAENKIDKTTVIIEGCVHK